MAVTDKVDVESLPESFESPLVGDPVGFVVLPWHGSYACSLTPHVVDWRRSTHIGDRLHVPPVSALT